MKAPPWAVVAWGSTMGLVDTGIAMLVSDLAYGSPLVYQFPVVLIVLALLVAGTGWTAPSVVEWLWAGLKNKEN